MLKADYETKMVTPKVETKVNYKYAVGPKGNRYNLDGHDLLQFLAAFGVSSMKEAKKEGWSFEK